MSRTHSSRGQTTPFVLIIIISLLFAAGLVYDGGQILAARREVADVASGAARAGAQEISIGAIRNGVSVPVIDPARANQAANDYLRRYGMTGTVTVTGDQVVVRTGNAVRLTLLTFGGLTERTVSATRSARAVRGVEGPDT